MALIRTFTRKDRERASLHDEIEATYTTFERDGRMLFQIDTYGRKSRQVPGKQSQTLQLDEQAARELVNILKAAFYI
jgi:hypothetical protein